MAKNTNLTDAKKAKNDEFYTQIEEKAEYLTIAEGIYNNFNSNDSWEEIVVADNYERYDALVDSIKRYYASLNGDSDDVAYEVEDIISYRFMELLSELDSKFKKKN